MDNPLSIIVASAALGLLFGVSVVALGFSALRSFIASYSGVLIIVMLVLFLQAPFILALLGTMAIVVFSFVPAAGGCVAGAMLIRAARLRVGRNDENAL
jgi:hypothetical protein